MCLDCCCTQLLRWQKKRPHDEGGNSIPEHTAAQDPAGTSSSSCNAAVAASAKDAAAPTADAAASTPQPLAEAVAQQDGDKGGNSSSSSSIMRPQLVLTLDSADQQPAAMAVLEAMYVAKTVPELLSKLTREHRHWQLLQAAVLADMWELPRFSAAAASQLIEEVNRDGQLSDATTQQLLTSDALPTCLEPLLRVLVLSVFGNLEAVWADEALQTQLLGLSLHEMKQLLSSDKLKVCHGTKEA